MPHITVQGVSEDKLRAVAKPLKKLFVDTTGVKAEYVKVFHSPIHRIDDENEIAVDIYWMHRSQEMCDKVAEVITAFFKQEETDFVQVTFTEFPGNLFYENGTHS